MKFTCSILSLIILCLISFSCNHTAKKQKEDTNNITNAKTSTSELDNSFILEDNANYVNDSTGQIATMTFNTDGTTNYYSSKDTNIFITHHSGLEYKFITRGNGKYFPKLGDIIYLDMYYTTDSDSIIFDSKVIPGDFKLRLNEVSHLGGSIEDAFSIMKEGDSAIFKINALNFLRHTKKNVNTPKSLTEESKLIFSIKINKIEKAQEFLSSNNETYNYYIEQENSLINRYILSSDYPIETTKSGLNILTISKGDGKKVNLGNTTTINYIAGFVDGGVFDSTIERNEPFIFKTGEHQVIPGLEEAVLNMNIGTHAIVIIPFRLGYGDQRYGIIPPFSTLVFEIDILDAR